MPYLLDSLKGTFESYVEEKKGKLQGRRSDVQIKPF